MKVACVVPFDLRLSWRTISTFAGSAASDAAEMAVWWEGNPTLVSMSQEEGDPGVISLEADPRPGDAGAFQQMMAGVLNADLDLDPFYGRASRDRGLREPVRDLWGLKPLRPPDIFQMVVIAVTEQQISMRAAYCIRERLVSSFGSGAGHLMAFPRAQDLAGLKPEELHSLGLSRRKAEYLTGIARAFVEGEIDPGTWEGLSDSELVGLLKGYRGMGDWTAEYILVRGLGRTDVVPASDLGVRRAVGRYLADGRDLSSGEVRDILRPWSPWRGLLAFYLLAHYLSSHTGLDQAQ